MKNKNRFALMATALTLGWIAKAQLSSETPYAGSSFNQVWNGVANDGSVFQGQASWIQDAVDAYGTELQPKLPHDGLSLISLLNGALKAAAFRTVNDKSDLLPPFKKIVHSNGV